jgi:hypothetical protein
MTLGHFQHKRDLETEKLRIDARKAEGERQFKGSQMQKGWTPAVGAPEDAMPGPYGNWWQAPEFSVGQIPIAGGTAFTQKGPFGEEYKATISTPKTAWKAVQGVNSQGVRTYQYFDPDTKTTVDSGIEVSDDKGVHFSTDDDGNVWAHPYDKNTGVPTQKPVLAGKGKGRTGPYSAGATQMAGERAKTKAQIELENEIRSPDYVSKVEKDVANRHLKSGSMEMRMAWKEMPDTERTILYAKELFNRVKRVYPGAIIDPDRKAIVDDGEVIIYLPW